MPYTYRLIFYILIVDAALRQSMANFFIPLISHWVDFHRAVCHVRYALQLNVLALPMLAMLWCSRCCCHYCFLRWSKWWISVILSVDSLLSLFLSQSFSSFFFWTIVFVKSNCFFLHSPRLFKYFGVNGWRSRFKFPTLLLLCRICTRTREQ